MALANIDVTVTESNITVDLQNTTVDVTSTTSNIVVGTASSTRFIEDVFDAGTLSGNISLDITNGTIQNVLLSGNVTGLTLNNFGVGSSLTAIFTQSGIGGSILDTTTYTSNWTNYNFANEYTDFDTNPNNYNILNIFNDGNEYYASLITETAPPVQNSDLANANIIVNGTTISLGSSGNIANFGPLTTDDLTEGSTNEYYTDARSRAAVSVTTASPTTTGSLVYNNSTGVFTFTPGQGNYGDSNVATLLASGTVGSDVITTANVSGNYILGNGAFLTGVADFYTDANVISLFSNYSNAINTSANIVSTSRMFFGRDDNESSWSYTPGSFKGISIGPETANAQGTPGFEFLSTRLYANGDVVPNTDNYASGRIRLHSEWNSSNTMTNPLYLSVGENQDPGGLGGQNKHSGIQATIYSQHTLGGGGVTPGVYSDGGFRNTIDFTGDTKIRGPLSMGALPGSEQDENFSEAVITGFNMWPLSLKVENNASVIRNFSAGSDVSNVHTFVGNVDITGNITATGNINYQNVEDLYVRDQQIVLNANAATDSDVLIIANRPVAGTNAAIKWNESTDQWQVNNGTGSYSDFLSLTNLSATNTASNTGTSFGSLSYSNSTGVFTLTESRPDAIFKECFAGDVYNAGVTRGQLVAISTPPTQAPGGGDQNLDINVVHPADAGNVQHRAFGIANTTGASYVNRISVVTSGMMNMMDTSAFRAGDTLFMSTTEGVMSNVAPTYASNVVIQEIGSCIYSDATHGIIDVKIKGSNAEDLTTLGNIHANGNIELTDNFFIGDLDGAVTLDVNNNTGSTLTKGQAVYLDGGNQGDTPNVALANASNFLNMPAVGIVRENIADQEVGQVVTSGVMNFSSHGFTKGEDLYISTTPGALVLISPATESNLVQKIGKVVSDNHILVQGAFRTNATPNLNANSIFIGRSDNYATTVPLSGLSSSIITDKRLEGDRFSGGNVTLPISQYLTSGQLYFKFDNAVDPFLPNGTKVFFQDTDANNPLSNGSITSDNIFYTRKSTNYSYYLLYSDEACQNLLTTSVPTTSPTNANVTFGSMIATGPLTMSAGTGAELVNGSNAYAKDFYVRNNVTIGETALRDAVLDVSGDATITNYSGNAALTLVNNRNDSGVPTQIVMNQNKNAGFAAGVAGDHLSVLKTQGMTTNTGSGLKTYANVLAKITDPTDGSEDGEIDFRLIKAGTETSTMLLKSTEMDLNVPLSSDSLISTTGNIQLGNSSTLTFGTDTNAGQMTFKPTGNINYITESDIDHNFTVYRDGANGVNLHMYKAGNVLSSPTAIGPNDFVHRFRAFGHDGTQFYDNSGAEYFVYQDDNTGSVGTDDVPLAHEFSVQRTPNTGFASSVLKMTADRRIIFNDTGVKGFGSYTGTANISADGKLHTAGNITSDGNISGSYILGNGSLLTGVSTDNFNQIIVSGQSNVDASGPTSLTLAESGDISITTDAANNKVTIGGSGGGYGNANVTNFLSSATSVGDVAFTGNLIVESGNTSYSPTSYEGNVTTGNVDRIVFSSDPGFYLGQPITFSGTTNSNLVFLNGNTYYVRGSGVSNTYDLLTDPGLTIGLTSGLGTETPNSLAGSVRNESNQTNEFYGNVDISRGAHLNVNSIKSYVPGGTFSISGIRATDVGLGSGGNNFFFPETGGNTRGGILVAQNDNVGVWEQGYKAEVLIASPITSNVTMLVNSSTGIHEKHRKARDAGSQVPGILSNNDRIHEVEYTGHDGANYQTTFTEHTYVDGDAALSIGANVVPLTKEFMTDTGGDVNAGFTQSIMKLTCDRTIIFNDTGTRNFGNYQGNANITQDGSINSVSTITGLNIKSNQFVQLKNYTTTEINGLTGMAAGDTVFNTTENTICFYTGSAWNKVTSTAL